MRQRSTSLR
ncbi:hypothetical protein LINPERHAP2_LOCUS39271 [Linum perenne]